MHAAQRIVTYFVRKANLKPIKPSLLACRQPVLRTKITSQKQGRHIFPKLVISVNFATLGFFGPSSGIKKELDKARSLIESSDWKEALSILNTLPEEDEVLSLRVTELISAKLYDEAINTLERILAKNPDDKTVQKEALALIAQCHAENNDFTKASKVLHTLYEMDDTDLITIWNYIEVCRQLRYQYSATAYQLALRALELTKNQSPEALNYFALVMKDWGLVASAEKGFEMLMQSFPKNQEYKRNFINAVISLNLLDKAEPVLLDLTEDVQVDSSSQALMLVYFHQNRMEDAKKLAQRMSKKFPENPQTWIYLAKSYIPSDVDVALKYFKKALSLNHNDPIANDGIASCLFLKGQFNESLQFAQHAGSSTGSVFSVIHMFDKAHAYVDFLAPSVDEKTFFKRKSAIYAHQLDYVNEFEYYKRYTKAAGNNFRYHLLENDFEKALQIAKGQGFEKTAEVLIVMGKNKEAFELLSQHVKGRVSSYTPLELYVAALSHSCPISQLDEAEEICKQFPSNFTHVMALSEVYRRKGNYQAAIDSWNRAHVINGSKALIYLPTYPMRYLAMQQYATILESMGDTAGAIEEYNKVLAINPKDVFSRERLAALQKK